MCIRDRNTSVTPTHLSNFDLQVLAKDPIRKVYLDEITMSTGHIGTPWERKGTAFIIEFMTQAFQKVLYEKATPREAIDWAAEEVNKSVERLK